MAAVPSLVIAFGVVAGWSSARAGTPAPGHPRKPTPPADARQIAVDDRADPDDAGEGRARVTPPVTLVAPAPPAAHGWQFAVGPYVWVSEVDANVSFGPLSTGVQLGFLTLARNTRYGAELLAEARHGRFVATGDVMYGSAAFTAGTTVASVMTTLSGRADSLMVDASAGYQVIGGDDATLSIEPRLGVRYQRTAVSGEVGVSSFTLPIPEFVDGGTDIVAGARAIVRPGHTLELSGLFDVGVAGASDRTWSAVVDASVQVGSRVRLSAGWRTLSMERSHITIQFTGPRVAVQLVF